MQSLTLQLAIPAEEFQRLYAGSAKDVVAVADNGQTVRFPAAILRSVVSHEGVYGRFRIWFDSNGSFQSLEQLPA